MINPWHKKDDPLVAAVSGVLRNSVDTRAAQIQSISDNMVAGTTQRLDGLRELEKMGASASEMAAVGQKNED
jgi:hypothetical protein